MKLRRLLTMSIAAIMTVSVMNIGVLADDVNLYDDTYSQKDNSQIVEIADKDISIQYEFSDIIEEDQNAVEDNMKLYTEDVERASFGTASFGVIRDGNTSRCEVYIYWNAQFLVSGWSFDSMPVANYNTYVPYDTIGGSWVPCSMQMSGSVYVKDVTIPTDVTRVKVKGNNLRAYCPTTDSMTATILSTYQNVTIN